jgi:hypothetical protein
MTGTGAATVLALALALLTTTASAAAEDSRDPTEATADTCVSAPLATSAADPAAASPVADAVSPDLSRGRWTRMARAPFGSEYEPVAWTGRRLLAVDTDSGRTAVYAPSRDRWREVARAPRRFDSTANFTWTGRELIILAMSPDGRSIEGAAYHPGRDRWRETARLATEPDGETDHALADALWSGTHVIVADSLGLLAAYDPAADCWLELGHVPGEPWVWRLYAGSPSLLVESRRWDAPVEVRAFDLSSMTWSEPLVGPLDREASEGGGSWVDGRLIYLTWYPLDETAGAANAILDPTTMTWTTFEHDCGTPASGTVAAGDLLVASDGRRALDGRTLACLDLPGPPRRLNGTERMLWTGDELIAWSGIRSLPEPARRGGYLFRPAGTP